MKKLPEIYKNISKVPINNNRGVYRFKNEESFIEEKIDSNKEVKETLKEIFNGLGNSYNILVKIITKDKEYETSLVSRTANNIVTIDNDVILIKDIINIKIL